MTTDRVQDVILNKKRVSLFSSVRKRALELTRDNGFVNGHDDIFAVLSRKPAGNDDVKYSN